MTDGPSPVVFVWSGWHRALVLADGWIIRPKETTVNRVPDSELVLVPGGTLITPTPEEGRALALTLARHSIHNIQPDLDVLMSARPVYSVNPDSLIAASQVVAIEFQTIAAANNYWRS
jgi:Hexameric tyrosine-coordinated heme protein (HTHP)